MQQPPYGPPPGQPPPQVVYVVQQPKKGMSGCMWLVLIAVVLFGGCIVIVGVAGVAGSKAHSPAATTTEAVETTQPTVTVTAAKLFADYQANEVSADSKYKGRSLAVSGSVASIRKDFGDDVVLSLVTSNQFESINATMQTSEAATAGTLSKGATVKLVCKGGGMVIGSPILSDCIFAQ